MKDFLSLTKVGNLKLGLVRSGQPIATERILVTLPTKENEENFKIIQGFKENGEEKVEVTLPFDDIDLNFEVFNVAFLTIDKVEYIAKAKNYEDAILLYPLNVEDFDKPIINFGIFSKEVEEKYNFKRTGFLKVHLVGYSGFGEVFYFKTNSINTIRSIKDQLTLLSSMTGGKLAGLNLILRPVKKDVNEKQIVYLSISFAGNIYGKELQEYLVQRKESLVNQTAMEDLYKNGREPAEDEIVKIEDMVGAHIEIDTNTEKEMIELKEKAEATVSEEASAIDTLFKEKGLTTIPPSMGLALYNAFVSANKVDEFEEFLFGKEEVPSLPLVMKKIKELEKKK